MNSTVEICGHCILKYAKDNTLLIDKNNLEPLKKQILKNMKDQYCNFRIDYKCSLCNQTSCLEHASICSNSMNNLTKYTDNN